MYIGIDIGGTNLKSAIVDGDANIIERNSERTNLVRENFVSQIINIIFNYLEQHPEINDVGIGIPGILNDEGTLIVSPNLTGLTGINLKEEIGKYFNLNIYIENDSNAASIGELLVGSAKDLKSFIYITLGTGVGGTIIHERKIFKGVNGGAGEIGHIKICCNKNYIENYQTNTLESLVARQVIIDRFKILIEKDESPEDEIDVEKISEIADCGNQLAIQTLEETAYYLGLGIAGTINLLDIPNIILGGGISQTSEIFYSYLSEVITNHLLPNLKTQFQLRKSILKGDSGIIGAAFLRRYFEENYD